MSGEVTRNICKYMNSRSTKQFTYIQVSCIREAIKIENEDRKNRKIDINTKTEEGRKLINKRAAELVNEKINSKYVEAKDIRLYKRCHADEYTDRTGKCAWGFKEIKERLGF